MALNEISARAIQVVEKYARLKKKNAEEIINQVKYMANIDDEKFKLAISNFKQNTRIAVHFHPDRIAANRKQVIKSIIDDGQYRSQWETSISNGGLSATKGGGRNIWEGELFEEVFDNADVCDFPKYGALDLGFYSEGPSIRFGSCYFVLGYDVLKRSTFTFLDSNDKPEGRGSFAEQDCLVSEILKELHLRDFVLGRSEIATHEFIEYLANLTDYQCCTQNSSQKPNLNHYIEAQVHGPINAHEDIDYIVCDPSFKGTEIEKKINELSQTFGIKVRWHRGFKIKAGQIQASFRGSFMPILGKYVAKNGIITAAYIGMTSTDYLLDNGHPLRRLFPDRNIQQELKYLWHTLVKFGEPF